MSEDDEQDVRGTWTVIFDGGPATAGNFAATIRTMAPRSWVSQSASASQFIGKLVAALDRAEFTPEAEQR